MSVALLRLQVSNGRRRRLRLEGHADHGDARLLQPLDLGRVVGQQPHRGKAKLSEDLHSIRIFAQVVWKAQLFVGLIGIQPVFMVHPVSLCLSPQTGSSAFLVKVDQHTALNSEQFARPPELPPAIAFTRAEYF